MNRTFQQTALTLITLLAVFCTGVAAGEDKYFDSDGTRIRYQVLGAGTPVILVHGYGADFDSNWATVIDVLTPRFKVIGMDARGHGKSGKPHDAAAYGVEMARDVIRLMDHLHIDKAHVAGYSMGGIIALKLASLYPDRLYSVVSGGNGLFSQENLALIGRLHQANMQKAIDQKLPLFDVLYPKDKEIPASKQQLVELMRKVDNDPLALSIAVGTLGQMTVTPADASAIHVPLLVVYGSLDDPLQTVASLKAAQPSTEVLVLEGEDHASAPYAAGFAQALREYFKRIKG